MASLNCTPSVFYLGTLYARTCTCIFDWQCLWPDSTLPQQIYEMTCTVKQRYIVDVGHPFCRAFLTILVIHKILIIRIYRCKSYEKFPNYCSLLYVTCMYVAALDAWGARRDYFERTCNWFDVRQDEGCYDETSDLIPLNFSAPEVRERKAILPNYKTRMFRMRSQIYL